MSVTWSYDGATNLDIDATGLPPGDWYWVVGRDADSFAFTVQADGGGAFSTTLTGIGDPSGVDGDTGAGIEVFSVEVRHVNGGDVTDPSFEQIDYLACNIFSFGTPSIVGSGFEAVWTYDGSQTFSVDYPGDVDLEYKLEVDYHAGGGGGSWVGDSTAGWQAGTGGTDNLSIFIASSPDAIKGYLVLRVRKPASAFPFSEFQFGNRMFVGLSTPTILGNPFSSTPAPVLVSSPPWRFVVTDLDSATLTFLDRLATSRQVTYVLNTPAVATGDVPSDDPEVNITQNGEPYLSYSNRLLFGFRREGHPTPWVVRFAGILMQVEREADSDQSMSHYTAYDPWQYWSQNRPLVNNIGVLPGRGGVKFKNKRGNAIALSLLNNALAAHGNLYADWGQTAFYGGTIENTDFLEIDFQQSTTLGDALTQLTDTGSMDIVLTPIYDPINRPGICVEVNIYNQAGTKRNGAIFAWDMPSRSLVGMDLLHDGSQLANKVALWTSTANQPVQVQSDAASIAKYGQYWLLKSLAAQGTIAAAQLLALAEVVLRRQGKSMLTINPAPERSPSPFVEYFLGDEVPVYASNDFGEALNAGSVNSAGDWTNLQRVYAIPIDIADDEIETVTQLLMADTNTGA